jgi:serine protease Do
VGIGFAIPIMQIRSLIPDMVRYGKSRKAWLGVQMQTLYPELAKILELTQPRGALITSVIKNSPAAAANMQGATSRMRFGNSLLDAGGDVILSINDVTIDSANDVINTIAQQRPGDSITIGVLRNNKREKIKVILGGI